MINKINNNQISNIIRDTCPKESTTAKSCTEQNADASLDLSTESVIKKAQQTTVENNKAVERARQLLLSGKLDSPENIRKAAENIIDFGV